MTASWAGRSQGGAHVPNEPRDEPTPAPARLEQLEWDEVRTPGSYLHLASGLIARVYAEDLDPRATNAAMRGGGAVVRLLPNPGAPMALLREIATRHGFRVNA
jgi:hypothetical protein